MQLIQGNCYLAIYLYQSHYKTCWFLTIRTIISNTNDYKQYSFLWNVLHWYALSTMVPRITNGGIIYFIHTMTTVHIVLLHTLVEAGRLLGSLSSSSLFIPAHLSNQFCHTDSGLNTNAFNFITPINAH